MQVQIVQSWDELLDSVRGAPASALVIVDPYFGEVEDSGLSVELSALLHRFPSTTVVAALALIPGRLDDVRRLGEWGVVQVIDLEEETTAVAVAFRLLEARGRPLRLLVERALPTQTAGAARAILAAGVQVVTDGGTGTDLARTLHVTTRTLSRWCTRVALPPPRHLLAWMRILMAAELLDDAGRTVSDVALSCGYAADASLRLALRRFVGRTPTQLRDSGAFDFVAQRFLEALAQARSERAAYRKRRKAGKSG